MTKGKFQEVTTMQLLKIILIQTSCSQRPVSEGYPMNHKRRKSTKELPKHRHILLQLEQGLIYKMECNNSEIFQQFDTLRPILCHAVYIQHKTHGRRK